MVTWAQYPLYLDPTWILKASSSNVWTGTLDAVTSDWGDANLRLGGLADNFNDGTNEVWTTTSGHSFSLSGGRAALTATEIHASGTWSNLTLGTTLNFASCGAANVLFRYTSSSSDYYLAVNFTGQITTLYKVVAGVTTALSPTLSVAMSANTNYDVKIVARGSSFEIWWAGSRIWSGTDSSPPPSPLSGNIGISETTSKCTLYADNVRLHDGSRWSGNYTSVVRDAYKGQTGDVVTQLRFLGAADSTSDVDLWVNASSDNVTWGGWHLVKTMAAPGTSSAVPDVDQKRYYQVRAVLRTGVDATPSVSEIDANEAAPPSGVVASTNTGRSPWYLYIGGDVNAVSGNLVLSWTDFAAQAKGLALSVVRTYNSALAGTMGPFGLGTMDPYHAHLAFPAGGNVTYTAGDGSVWTFVTMGGNAYSPPRGLHDNLVKNADGSYTLWVSDGSRTNFNAAGQLTSLVDRNGNHLTLTYTSGNPTKVADDSGLALTLIYDTSNRVSSVVNSGNRGVSYTYDTSNRLTTFTDPMGFTENDTYDASNRLVQRVDRAGHADRFVYDANGRVTQTWTGEWSYATSAIRWQVEAYAISYVSGTQTTATNALGGLTTATFNSLGNPTSIVGPSVGCALCRGGNATSYTWDGEFDALTVADGRGDTTTTAVDWMGNPLSVRDPSGNSTVRSYTNVQNATQFLVLLLTSRNARLFTTRYTYYANGNLYGTVLPGGNTSYRFYDAAGSLTRLQDFRGHSVTYGYDAHEFRTSAADAGGNTTTYQNDILGRTWNVTMPGGNTTRTVYDADGRVMSTTNPLLHATTYLYDKDGRATSVTDPNNLVTTTAYNQTFGSVQKTTSPGGNTTQFVYDSAGDRVQTIDANNHVTKAAYDTFRRTINETTPLGHVTKYVYDAAGNVLSKTEPNGTLLVYASDTLNRIVRTMYPGGSTQTTTYDADGNAVEKRAFDLDEFYAYDALDRVIHTRQVFLDTALTVWHNYTYDADGNRQAMDGSGGGNYTWDANNRIRSETDAAGNRWTYNYGRDGQLLREVYPDGGYVTYGYDSDGRLTQESDYASTGALFQSISYGYDPAGRRTSVASFNTASLGQLNVETSTLANTTMLAVAGLSPSPQSVTVSVYASLTVSAPNYNPPCPTTQDTWSYILNKVATTIFTANPGTGNNVVCQRTFGATYSATVSVKNGDLLQGQITFENDAIVTTTLNYLSVSYRSNQGTTTYVYDRESRLIKVTNPDGSTVQYTYDAVGNRLTYTSGATISYIYNADNELTSQSNGTSYGYDANGNLISKTAGSVATTYRYNYASDMTPVSTTQTLSNSCTACTVTSYVKLMTLVPSSQSNTISVTASGGVFDDTDYPNCPSVTVSWEYVLSGHAHVVGSVGIGLAPNTKLLTCRGSYSGTYSSASPVGLLSGETLYAEVVLDAGGSAAYLGGVEATSFAAGTVTVAPYGILQYGPDGVLAAEAAPQGSTTTHLGYDLLGMAGLPQRVASYSGVTLSMSYFYGVGSDRPLDVLVGGVSYYYHRDGLDSTTALTDAAGDTVASYRYDAYGNLASGSSDAVGNALRFDAMASDPTSGLVYDRARMYDPSTGRFLTPDPLGGGYAFAGDDPTNAVDPSGMVSAPAEYVDWADAPVGCTLAQEQDGECGPAIPAHFGGAVYHGPSILGTCAVSVALFVGGLVLGFLGIGLDLYAMEEGAKVIAAQEGLDFTSAVGGDPLALLNIFLDLGSYYLMRWTRTATIWDFLWTGSEATLKLTPLGLGIELGFVFASLIFDLPGLIHDCSS